MLVHLAVLVGHKSRAAQMIRVVVPDEFALAVDDGCGEGLGSGHALAARGVAPEFDAGFAFGDDELRGGALREADRFVRTLVIALPRVCSDQRGVLDDVLRVGVGGVASAIARVRQLIT